MIPSGRLFFWLLPCCNILLLTNADDGQPVRGVPGIDYPDYQTIPHTSFRCSEQQLIPGLYADPETGCQMFHHCYEHRHESFLCPPGTIFNQAILACDYWYSADCSAATSHYNIKSQHEASNIGPSNPSVNIFNKLASLYDVKEPLSFEYASEEDGTGTHNSVSLNYQEYDNSILKVSSIQDRHEGVITETYNDHGYSPYRNKHGDQLGIFDDFESSGEPDDYGEQENYEVKFSALNDSEKAVDFEKQYFGYDEVKVFDYDSEHQLSNEELFPHFSGIQNEKESSSKDHMSEDAFFRRQSKAIENRNIRKQRRRKPIYTIIEHKVNIKEFTTTERPKHKIDINLNNTTDSPSYSQESVTTSNSVSTLSASKIKRRKPVIIQLEDSYEYNVDKSKISSIKYGNPQSNIPEFSMDAEEISVKLFPSDTKRKPVDRLMQHQFNNKNSNEEMRSLNNIANHESNIFHTSTLSVLDDIDSFGDISMNLNKVFPKRKKNVIRIIDFDDNNDIYTDNKELKDFTTFRPTFEKDFTPQSTGANFEDYDKFVEPHFDSQDVEKAHEMADGYSELVRQLEDNYDSKNELEAATPFTPTFEDDFTIKSASTNFKDYDKFAEPHFDSKDVEKFYEIADGNPELMRQLEDNHNVYIQNEEFEDATIFTPTVEDEFTTQSLSTTFENFDEFSALHFHDYDPENTREIEEGLSDIVKQTENNHDVYIENEEINESTTLASIIEDEFTTQSSNTNFKDFDKIFYPTFDDHNIEIDHEIENVHLDLVSQQYEDSYSDFITPYPHIEMLDEAEDTHFNQMNPGATSHEEEHENEKYLEYIRDFPNYKSFEDFEIKTDKENEDYSFTTTEFSIPEISSNVPHSEGESNRFYFNPNTTIESPFDDSGTSESLSHQVSEISNENNFTMASNSLSNHTNETDSNDRVDIEVDHLINKDINKYLINENSKDKLDSLKNHLTGASIHAEEKISTIDSLEEHYNSYNTLYDIDSKETDISQIENESNIETIQHKLEFDQNIHQSDEPMDPGVLDKIEFKSIENIDKITETSSFEDSEIDFEDLTKIVDDLENYHKVAENDPISDQEHIFNPKHDSDGKAKLENSSKIRPGKTISNIGTNVMNKGFSNLPQNNPGNIKKDNSIRIPRMFMPPYNRDFNFEKLGSRNFASIPYSMMQLKQKSMNKLLGSPMDGYGIRDIKGYYSTRTGDLLESSKISKLISIGKNLLNAKKAKLRILRRYVNY